MSVTTLRLKTAVAVLLGIIVLSYVVNWKSAQSLYQHIYALGAVADRLAEGDRFTTAVLGMIRIAGEKETHHLPLVVLPFLGALKSSAYAASPSLARGGYPPRAECGRSLL